MREDYTALNEFVEEMKTTTKTNTKREIVAKWKSNDFVKNCLCYTLSAFKKYHVSSSNLIKNSELRYGSYDNLFVLLDDLSNRVITGHDAIGAINSYVEKLDEQYKYLVYNILDRSLEIRANARLINKEIPGLIRMFEVALAKAYDPKYIDFENETWLASRKLDGVRCVAICDENKDIKLYSRQGKTFETLGKVIQSLQFIMEPNTVLDGELCILDDEGNEDFQSIMKEIRRKDHTISNPMYLVFDSLTLAEFNTGTSCRTLSERNRTIYDSDYVQSLEFDKVTDLKHIQDLIDEAEDFGYEGIMLRRDTVYKGKRSNDILKVKKFHDAEYIVKDLDFATHRIIEDGVEFKKEMLAQIYITHKGNRVGVGSGFSKEQRKYYFDNKEELIGKTVTVQYFEESKNQEGEYSLRFPVVKTIYDNGRDC